MVHFLDSCLGLVLDYSIRLGTICDGYRSGLGCCTSDAKLKLKIQLFGKGYVELHQQVGLKLVSHVLLLHCVREDMTQCASKRFDSPYYLFYIF